jgi:uncharacterized membrane protein required for colicin V production
VESILTIYGFGIDVYIVRSFLNKCDRFLGFFEETLLIFQLRVMFFAVNKLFHFGQDITRKHPNTVNPLA